MKNKNNIPEFGITNFVVDKHDSFVVEPIGGKKQEYDFEIPHRHSFYELIVFFTGGGTHDIDFETHSIKKCSVHFVSPNNVHLVARKSNTIGCSLIFSNEYIDYSTLERLPFYNSIPVLNFNTKDFKEIATLVLQIKQEYQNKKEESNTIIKNYFNILLHTIIRSNHSIDNNTINKSTLIDNFLKLIKVEYQNHLNVEQCASKLNVSSKHLIELCKKETGKTPLQYIKEYTVSEAKRLLFHTSLSIKEIAYQLNFDDASNFSKYFKATTSYSPLEYRNGIGK